jgi:hypothetical protein
MKIARFLRIFAVIVIIATVVFWAAAGANTGRTNLIVENVSTPEVKRHFSPGIEYVAYNALFAAVLFGASFLPFWKDSRKP